MRSIIDNEKKCIICEATRYLHRHHIFYGAGRRKTSEKYGCWCYLCPRHHNLSNIGVHSNTALDRKLKAFAQKKFNEVYPHLDFIKIFGKSYLEE